MCSIATAYVQQATTMRGGYHAAMHPEQRIIANWMTRLMAKRGWTAQSWAEQAGTSPTNISRAIKDDFTSLTTVRTLHQLAVAAKIPSVLDFLEDQDGSPAFNEEAAAGVISEILRRAPKGGWKESDAPRLARTIGYGLQLPAGGPAKTPSKDAVDVAARAAVDRLLEERHEA